MKSITVNTTLGTLRVMPTEENKKALNFIACELIHASSAIKNPNHEYRDIILKTLEKLRSTIYDALDSVGYYNDVN